MSGGLIEAKTRGIEAYVDALNTLIPRMKRRVLLIALRAAGRVVQKAAKAAAPVLSMTNKLSAPYRKPGTIRDAIKVRTSKASTRAGDVGVFVNVKPAKGCNVGAKNPNDPFYWRWQNFGWTPRGGRRGSNANAAAHRKRVRAGAAPKIAGKHFLEAGVAQFDDAVKAFESSLGPRLQGLNTNPKDPL